MYNFYAVSFYQKEWILYYGYIKFEFAKKMKLESHKKMLFSNNIVWNEEELVEEDSFLIWM
jgi:hypothetical protein